MNNKNSIFYHIKNIGAGALLSMILSFITAPIITRVVDPSTYGEVAMFGTYASLAVTFLCLGMDQSFLRYYYKEDKDIYRRTLLFKCFLPTLLISMVVLGAFSILFFNRKVELVLSKFSLIMLDVYILLQVVYRFSLLAVRYANQTKKYSFLVVLQKLTYVLAIVFLVQIINKNYYEIMIITTVLSLAICVIFSINFQKNIWNFRKGLLKPFQITSVELLAYGGPFIVASGVDAIFNAIDKLVLKYFGTNADIGVYSVAYGLVSVMNIFQTIVCSIWAPMTFEHYEKNMEDTEFYAKGNKVVTVVMFIIGYTFILLKDLIIVILGEKYRSASTVVPMLVLSPVMYTISETTVSGLYFKKKSGLQVIVSVVACVVNLLGNVLLIPILGEKGAAISTGLSFVIYWAVRTKLSNKVFYIDFSIKKFILSLIFFTAFALYNTFMEFSILIVGMYIICMLELIIMYKEDIKYILKTCKLYFYK